MTYHCRLGGPLLGLKEDDLILPASRARLLDARQLHAQRVSEQAKNSKQARDKVRGCLCLCL
jgi:hypothetical protein